MEKKKSKLKSLLSVQEFGIFIIFLVLCIVIGCISPKFFKLANLINILRQISNVGIMAVGEAMVIIIAGIDLSISAILSLSACTAAVLAQYMNPWIAVLIALLVGGGVGMLNGLLSVKIGIAPFIATLGTQMMAKGVAFMITKGIPVKFQNSASILGGWKNCTRKWNSNSGSNNFSDYYLYYWNCRNDSDSIWKKYLCSG